MEVGASDHLSFDGRRLLLPSGMSVAETSTDSDVTLSLGGSISPVFNVKTLYGAAGDGTTDDTTAVRNAIVAASAAGGGIVYLPAGTYKISGTLTLGSNMELRGAGIGATKIAPAFATATQRVVDNDWTNGNVSIGIRDLTIDRSGANVQHGILLNGVDGLTVDHVRISGMPSANAGCVSVSQVGPTTRLESKNVRVTNCDFRDTSNYGVVFGYVTGAVISGCTFYNSYREAVGVEPVTGTVAQNITVTGNTIYGSATSAGSATGLLVITNSSGGTFTSVTVSGNSIDGGPTAIASDASPGIFVQGATSGVTISGNTIRRTNGPGIATGAVGATTNGLVVSNNNVYTGNQGTNTTPNAAGIRVRQTTASVFTGNTISGAAFNADIEETGTSTGNVYTGNLCQDAVQYLTMAVGSFINTQGVATLTFPGAGGAVSVDSGLGNYFVLTVTDATAFTINSPSNHTKGKTYTYEINNASGGVMGAVSFGAQHKLAGSFTVPASGKRRTITFIDNGSNLVEVARSAADI
jgi:hypothetical protein